VQHSKRFNAAKVLCCACRANASSSTLDEGMLVTIGFHK
jgi:hypothetical protein